jgi:hypothetical protein
LDGSAVSARRHNLVDAAPVMLEVLLGGKIQVESKVVHCGEVNAISLLEIGLKLTHINHNATHPHIIMHFFQLAK